VTMWWLRVRHDVVVARCVHVVAVILSRCDLVRGEHFLQDGPVPCIKNDKIFAGRVGF
jgi:hypothetical protein